MYKEHYYPHFCMDRCNTETGLITSSHTSNCINTADSALANKRRNLNSNTMMRDLCLPKRMQAFGKKYDHKLHPREWIVLMKTIMYFLKEVGLFLIMTALDNYRCLSVTNQIHLSRITFLTRC